MSTLAVTDLTVSHFRSHKRARLELNGLPVAIYGPNGAGKTNLLEALSLLSPGRGLRRASADEMAHSGARVGWKITANLQSLHQTHDVETWAEPPGARQTRIDGKTAAQVALGRISRVLWMVPSMDRLWTEGADGRRRFLDRMTMSFEPAHAETVLTYEKAMRERNRLLKDRVRDPSWYLALEHQMSEAGAKMTANRLQSLNRVAASQYSASTSFPSAELALIESEDAESHVEQDALLLAYSNSRGADMAAGRTLCGPHRSDLSAIYSAKNIAARHCSTGEQKALLISLILANARALTEDFGAPPIMLLDEVAAHLDADRRATLYDEICSIGSQAFLTGTGAELFTELGQRAQHFKVTEDTGVRPD